MTLAQNRTNTKPRAERYHKYEKWVNHSSTKPLDSGQAGKNTEQQPKPLLPCILQHTFGNTYNLWPDFYEPAKVQNCTVSAAKRATANAHAESEIESSKISATLTIEIWLKTGCARTIFSARKTELPLTRTEAGGSTILPNTWSTASEICCC